MNPLEVLAQGQIPATTLTDGYSTVKIQGQATQCS